MCVWVESRRAGPRKLAPIAGAMRLVAAIDKPMPIEVEKNRMVLP